jgi:hypothetical protein
MTDRRKLLPVFAPPKTRGACIDGTPLTGSRDQRQRGECQCRALECRYNLLVRHPNDRPGRRHARGTTLTWSFANVDANAQSCVLDVADAGPQNPAAVAKMLGLSLAGARFLLDKAVGKLRAQGIKLSELMALS